MQGADGEWSEIEPNDEFEEEEEFEEEDSGTFEVSPDSLQIDGSTEWNLISSDTVTLTGQSRLGWECPRCHACHAPHVDSCPNCLPQAVQPVINPSPYVYPTTIPYDGNGGMSPPYTVTVSDSSSGLRIDGDIDGVTSGELRVYSDQYE